MQLQGQFSYMTTDVFSRHECSQEVDREQTRVCELTSGVFFVVLDLPENLLNKPTNIAEMVTLMLGQNKFVLRSY